MRYTNVQRVRILYKTILRLHRGLPEELQIIGTNYARDEFKRHKNCNVKEADIFLAEWTNYAISLIKQLGVKGVHMGSKRIGSTLSQSDIDQLRDEQIVQLYELMVEATNAANNEPNKR